MQSETEQTPISNLTQLQRHAQKLATIPAEWMPWNYRETLERIESLSDSAWSYDESRLAGNYTLRSDRRGQFELPVKLPCRKENCG